SRKALQRRVGLAGHRVVQNGVAMRERSALRVLARKANRDAFLEERRVRECLGLPPVDPSVRERLAPALELTSELGVDGEAVGNTQELLVQPSDPAFRDR